MTPRLRRTLLLPLVALPLLAIACNPLAEPEGWATPLFDDGTLYYFPDQDRLLAVESGPDGPTTAEWEFPDDNRPAEEDLNIEAVYTVPILDDGILYFAGWEGEIYAVSADDGRLEWSTNDSTDITGSIVSGLVLHEDTLYFGTTEGQVYALDAQSGQPAEGWDVDEHTFDKGIWATPVLDGDTLYIATMTGDVHALNLPSGEPAWDEPFTAATGAIPELALLETGMLWVPSVGKRVYLVDPETGEEAAPDIETEHWVWTTPVLQADIAYFGDFDGVVHAVDITTGQQEWQAETGDKIKAAPVIVDGTLVVADRSPAITFIDLATGEVRNRVPLDDAGTIRADLVAREGVAYALGTNGPLFRADPENLTVVQVSIAGAPD